MDLQKMVASRHAQEEQDRFRFMQESFKEILSRLTAIEEKLDQKAKAQKHVKE